MSETTQTTDNARVIEVTMKFWKVFHIVVPEGVTEEDVIECNLVDDETRSDWEVDREHDETTTKDIGPQDEHGMDALRRHSKVFTWKEAE